MPPECAHDAPDLPPLLDYLGRHAPSAATVWQGWRIAPVGGAGNNLLYRATGDGRDLAVKFTIRDARDRAGREYGALSALQGAGLDIAPRPVLLDRARAPQPVVVQTWLGGAVAGSPPTTDADWRALIDHFAAIHTLTPETTARRLPDAVLTMHSAAAGKARIREQLARVPPEDRPAGLRELVTRVERATSPDWPSPPVALCRCDPNTLNFIRRPGRWASVDWENSGWGDPAFDLADLLTHPKYSAVPPERRGWVIDTYCGSRAHPGAATRIRDYSVLCLVWWAARLARMLHEVPRGLDERLVRRSAGWQAETEAKYERYLLLATAALASVPG